MGFLDLLRIKLPGFRARRRAFLAAHDRVRAFDPATDRHLVVLDLGLGRELWVGWHAEQRLDRRWRVPAGGTLIEGVTPAEARAVGAVVSEWFVKFTRPLDW